MSKPMKLVVDLSKPKGEREQYIELADEEIAQLDADAAVEDERRQAEAEAQAEREAAEQSAKDKLASLGLTAEEIAAITK